MAPTFNHTFWKICKRYFLFNFYSFIWTICMRSSLFINPVYYFLTVLTSHTFCLESSPFMTMLAAFRVLPLFAVVCSASSEADAGLKPSCMHSLPLPVLFFKFKADSIMILNSSSNFPECLLCCLQDSPSVLHLQSTVFWKCSVKTEPPLSSS